MMTWQWIALGVTVALALSLSVALAIVAVLGSISRDVSRMLEAESWAIAGTVRRKAPTPTV